MARNSLSMSRSSMEGTSYEAASESSAGNLGSNTNSIAYLVYANRGDPYTAGYKVPTTRDIPQVKLPRVDHTKDADLSSYVSQLRKFEEAQSNEQAVELAHNTGDGPDDGGSDGNGITPLTAIPDPFFSEDFQLDNPRVYDAVIGEEDSNMIQEKLSWYVDIIEAHLAREIARASTQFFAATAKFGAIEEQAAQTCNRIAEFSEYAENQQKVVQHHLETVQLQEKLRDAASLCDNLQVLADLKTAVESLESIVDEIGSGASGDDTAARTSKLAESVAIMTEARSRAQNDKIDLSRVVATHPFLERLAIAENRLKSSVASIYVRAMLDDLRATQLKLDASNAPGSAMPHAQQQEIAEQQNSAQTRAAKSLEVAGQLDARKLALAQYRVEVDREVKQIIRRNVPNLQSQQPTTTNEHSEETQQALARSLHSLSSEDADEMCTKLFAQLSTLFIALKEQNIPDIGPEVLDGAVRSADSRMARVLRVRKDLATTLTPENFVAFYAKVTEFCDTCLAVTDMATEAVELQEFLVAQTKLYIHSMHALIDAQLTSALDSDDWRRAEVTPAAQRAVDIIASMDAIDPDSWSLDEVSDENAKNKQRIELGSQTFVVSKSTVQVLVDLINYLRLANSLPPQHNINLSYQLIDLLNLFNHKTHHLILGFGATKTAGLKHISVKNLVLCFESLRLLETLQSYIKKFIERHLPPKSEVETLISSSLGSGGPGTSTAATTTNDKPHSASSEIMSNFDSVQQSYFDHRSEIHRKLVKLMSDKVAVYSRQIGLTDWSQMPPQANKYMLDLVRQTTTVAHIAQEMLPPNLSTKLVEEIFAAYKPKLLEAYANVQVETVQEKRSVLRDLKYFRSKSEQLKGSGNTGEVIYESVNGFVAPELTLEPEPAYSARTSLDLPRDAAGTTGAAAAARASLDEADTTLAYEPEPEPESEAPEEQEPTQVLPPSVLAKEEASVAQEPVKEPVKESIQESGQGAPEETPQETPQESSTESKPEAASEPEPVASTESEAAEEIAGSQNEASQEVTEDSPKDALKEESPQHSLSHGEQIKEETPEKVNSVDETSKEETPIAGETPKEETPKEETSKDESPVAEETPKEAAQTDRETPKEQPAQDLTPAKEEQPAEEVTPAEEETVKEEVLKPESPPIEKSHEETEKAENTPEAEFSSPTEDNANGHSNHSTKSKEEAIETATAENNGESVSPLASEEPKDQSAEHHNDEPETTDDTNAEVALSTENTDKSAPEHNTEPEQAGEKPQAPPPSKQGLTKSQKKRASKKKNKKK